MRSSWRMPRVAPNPPGDALDECGAVLLEGDEVGAASHPPRARPNRWRF